MAIKLDFNNMLSGILGPLEGLSPDEVWALQPRVMEVHRQIRERSGRGGEFLGFLDLPFKSEADLAAVVSEADRMASLGDRHVILGIGGSYLGARALIEGLLNPYRNELTREERAGRPRIYYEGNAVDADALHNLMAMLPESRPVTLADDVTVNVISKSGTTLETAVAFRFFQQRMKQVYGADHAPRVVATTDAARGRLKAIADAEGYRTFKIPDEVGGRYSVLTPVGLLPAAVAGVDVREVVAGARFMAERCQNPDLHQNPAYLYAALQHLSYRARRPVSVMAAWTKRLEYFTFWYDQLCAESLGKDGQGRIPISTVNTRDLHSRGQEIQDGPRNTVVTNLIVESPDWDVVVPAIEGDADGLNYVAGKHLSEMLLGAAEGTAYAYAKASRPSMNLLIPQLNGFTMGQLIYLFELSTVAEGYLMGINPLDQPGVEEYKKFMFGNLGREDMRAYRAEFEARLKGSSDFVV
jgi:glucose-6-phosphate isomerase